MKALIFSLFFYCTMTSLSFSEEKNLESEAFIAGCLSAYPSEQNLQNVLSSISNLNDELQQIYIEHHSLLERNPNFIERICMDAAKIALSDTSLLQMLEKESEYKNSLSRTAANMTQQIMNSYFEKGLQKIEGASLAPYFSFKKAFFINADPMLCKIMIQGAGDLASDAFTMQSLMMKQQSQIPADITANYLKLSRQAILLTVENKGSNIVFLENEAANLEKAFGDYLFNYAVSFDNAEKLARILAGEILGTNEEYCDVGRLYYGALKTMLGEPANKIRELYIYKLAH